jgi:hypothetical protein
MGCVIFFSEGDKVLGEVEYKLAQDSRGLSGQTDGKLTAVIPPKTRMSGPACV